MAVSQFPVGSPVFLLIFQSSIDVRSSLHSALVLLPVLHCPLTYLDGSMLLKTQSDIMEDKITEMQQLVRLGI
jgi:hypothetical protein